MTTPATIPADGELLACPFCGGEAKHEEQMDEDIWSHNTVPWRRVGCNQCEIWTWTCEGFDPSETEAWNRRATPSPGKAEAGEDTRKLLTAASHALRSYQYGNASPDLAESIADRIDAAVQQKRDSKEAE